MPAQDHWIPSYTFDTHKIKDVIVLKPFVSQQTIRIVKSNDGRSTAYANRIFPFRAPFYEILAGRLMDGFVRWMVST